jgi:hypothetical protein
MVNRLSHSQCSKYQLCPQAYDYHYNKKIRPSVHSAALSFGSAFDEAINIMLLNKPGSPEEVFLEKFTNGDINGKTEYLPTHPKLVYANADFDADLLSEDDFTTLGGIYEENPSKESIVERVLELKNKKSTSGLPSFSDEERTFFNLANWLVLKNKGLMMIDAYRQQVMPKFTKIHAVQVPANLKNSEGDSIIGYIDVIADIEGYGTVIIDNKTSSMLYEQDSVVTSPQLSLYVHMEGDKYNTRKAGYIVLLKQVVKNKHKICSVCGNNGTGRMHKSCDAIIEKKRCGGKWNETINPKINIQIIVDEIPHKTEEIVIDNYDNINQAIKNGVYTKNFNSCKNHFGGNCPYIKLCFKDSMDGLVDVNVKKG